MSETPEFSLEPSDVEGIDFSGFSQGQEVQEPQETSTPPSEDPTNAEVNPLWAPYLKDVPEGLHQLVTPAFKAWDNGVRERFESLKKEWAPFQTFRDQNVDPEYLQKAYNVAQQLQSDPVGLYAQLHQYFQQSPQHLQQAIQMGLIPDPNSQQQAQEPNSELNPEDPNEKVAELQRELEQFKQQTLAQQQEQYAEHLFNQEYERSVQQIESDFSQIEQRTGPLPPQVKAEIVKQAQFMGQQSGQVVSVIEAAPHVFRFMQQARAGIKPAPRPVGGGAIPQSRSFDPTTATQEERVAHIAAIVEANREQ